MHRKEIEQIKANTNYILDGCLKSFVENIGSLAILILWSLRFVFESILFGYKAKLSGI